MAKNIVFTNDFLYYSFSYAPTYHWWVIDLLNPIINIAINQNVVQLCDWKNADGEIFSRDKFYELSGINNQTEAYYHYDVSKIKPTSIDYLKSFINENTFVIGIELGIELKNILTNLNIPFINLWFHSWKLFDDAFFMINTNDEDIFKVLKKYQVPHDEFLFYANYWKIWTEQRHRIPYDKNLVANSAVFIGQTLRDKSTDKNGRYLNILDYKDRLADLAKMYDKIYYLPHPYVSYNQEIEEYIKNTPYIEEIKNIPTYQILMSDKIKKVVSISSSVLYEAQFWNKEIEYLFKPLFNIDGNFQDDTFISIYQDYFKPIFWCEILAKFFKVNQNPKTSSMFYDGENKFRNIKNLYYGYESFNEHKIICSNLKTEINTLRNEQKYVIQVLNKQTIKHKCFS